MWIETFETMFKDKGYVVTSLAEVWIETDEELLLLLKMNESLPLRKCGLKLRCMVKSNTLENVTSLAEVWIETTKLLSVLDVKESLPLRKCGLKRTGDRIKCRNNRHFPCGSVD